MHFFQSLRNISTHTFDGRGKPEHTQENCSEMSHFVAVAFLFKSAMSNLNSILILTMNNITAWIENK